MNEQDELAMRYQLEELKAKLAETEVELNAWKSAFGTTQLTHALAKLAEAERRLTPDWMGCQDLMARLAEANGEIMRMRAKLAAAEQRIKEEVEARNRALQGWRDTEQRAREAEVEGLYKARRWVSDTMGHDHWREGGHGGSCNACDRGYRVSREIDAEIARLRKGEKGEG